MGTIAANIILPLFGIMVVGCAAGYFGVLNRNGSAFLSRFVFVVALPALAFIKLSHVPAGEFFNWPFLGALGGGMLATMAIAFVVARLVFPGSLTAHGMHGLTAMYSSTGYVGLPLILLAFGDQALVPGLIGAVITGTIFLPIAVLLAEIDRGRREGAMSFTPFYRVLSNPVLIATTAGLLCSTFGIDIPKPAAKLFELLGDAYVPCALFSAGLFMSGGIVRTATAEIGWLIAVKLVLHPVIAWWLAYRVFELEGILPAIVVLQAALPCGVPVFVLAQHYNTFTARSNAVIVISTALSVFTLSALLIALKV
ncbi:MAG: AEC family transporter [Rhizobiales bacterium]|nr:AEC family transporter [Hyphomicrobiales bacterium]